jgi:hypothetical protein
MTLLLGRPAAPAPPVVTRNKTEVITLVKFRAPTKVKRDAKWWATWLEQNWT